MRVLKFGGSSLKTAPSMLEVGQIIMTDKERKVVVVSAVSGVTESLLQFIAQPRKEAEVREFIKKTRDLHAKLIDEAVRSEKIKEDAAARLDKKLEKLERMLYGISYLEEVTPKTKDFVQCYGERLSVILVAAMLKDQGVKAVPCDADELGIMTDGVFGAATADLDATRWSIVPKIQEMFYNGEMPIVTGFFGVGQDGSVTVFGRNGSDYSAAAIANALDAEVLEIWKDVDGFLSVDPKIVPKAVPIKTLSYDEAAELAYFGAKVLHPMTVEPARAKNIVIKVKNVFNPKAEGTSIQQKGDEQIECIKSISCMRNLAIIKVFGEGAGYRTGVMTVISQKLSDADVNIYSAVTSQTCIALLIDKKDLGLSRKLLEDIKEGFISRIETSEDWALLCIVGEGLGQSKGIASRVFNAVAMENVSVGLISAGASLVAYHFTVHLKDLERATRAVHQEFFGC
ncbi:MAG: putative aspartokinase [Methanomassiliicoccales archaeon PtaU1.Bin124]|nr:MAG: putative aspartokinase [Methanomassiliicoccales archaeon PtaU1.Bin124]